MAEFASAPPPHVPALDPLAPIGIFDSGVGGLTVARAIIDQLPGEAVIYIGDTAHGPYGPLELEEVREHALDVADKLVGRGVKALVIACNTASAAILDHARSNYDIPVLGVIDPAVRRAVQSSRSGRIGVIGTSATISSKAYDHAFDRYIVEHPEVALDITTAACPRFVDFVERGMTSGRQILGLAEAYLEPMRDADVDTLVLGCTHYPLLSGVIQLAVGDPVNLVSSAEETTKDIVRVLTARDGLRPLSDSTAPRTFLATGDPARFAAIASRFLGPSVGVVNQA